MKNYTRVEDVSLLQHGRSYFHKDNDLSSEVNKVVKANILVSPPKHVPPKNLHHTYHSDNLRMYNP
jgi:hypothetical protein